MDIYEQLERQSGIAQYCAQMLAEPELATWERKEYQAVFDGAKQEMIDLEKAIEFYESTRTPA